MIAVVTGSTGLVGQFIISYLLAEPKYTRVIVLSRRELELRSPKLEVHIIDDFQNLGRIKIDRHAHFFCAVGTTIKKAGSQELFKKIDLDSVIEIARWAKSNEALSFSYVSAQGANKNSNIFYSRIKGQVESELNALDFKHLLIYRPGLLMGERRADPRFFESMAQGLLKLGTLVLPKKLVSQVSTSASDLAFKMIRECLTSNRKTIIFESSSIEPAQLSLSQTGPGT